MGSLYFPLFMVAQLGARPMSVLEATKEPYLPLWQDRMVGGRDDEAIATGDREAAHDDASSIEEGWPDCMVKRKKVFVSEKPV